MPLVHRRFQDRLAAQIQTRKTNDGAVIENPLGTYLRQNARESFANTG